MVSGNRLGALTIGSLALAALTIFGTASVSGAERDRPPRILVSRANVIVPATLGSYCWKRESGGSGVNMCGDAAFPLPVKCRLPVKPGGRIKVDTRLDATRLSVGLVRLGKDDFGHLKWSRTKQRPNGRRHWTFRLPKAPASAGTIEISATYEQGGASSWAGLETENCRTHS